MQNNWRDWMTHLLAVEEVDMDALPATKDTKAIGFWYKGMQISSILLFLIVMLVAVFVFSLIIGNI